MLLSLLVGILIEVVAIERHEVSLSEVSPCYVITHEMVLAEIQI